MARKPGAPAAQSAPSISRSFVPPQRRAGSLSSPAASTFLGACGPGRGKWRRRPQETARSRRLCSGPRASSGRWYLPSSAPGSLPAVRSPQGPAQGQGSLSALQAQGPALNSPILSVGHGSPQTGRLFPTLEVRQRPRVFSVWMDAKSCCVLLQAPASLRAVPHLF